MRGYADSEEIQDRQNRTSSVAYPEFGYNSQDESSGRSEESFRKFSNTMSNNDNDIDTDVRKAEK